MGQFSKKHALLGHANAGSAILTDPEAQKTLETPARSIGFTRIEVTDPRRHDTIISYTSQLAHVVSSAYIKSLTSALTLGFIAGKRSESGTQTAPGRGPAAPASKRLAG